MSGIPECTKSNFKNLSTGQKVLVTSLIFLLSGASIYGCYHFLRSGERRKNPLIRDARVNKTNPSPYEPVKISADVVTAEKVQAEVSGTNRTMYPVNGSYEVDVNFSKIGEQPIRIFVKNEGKWSVGTVEQYPELKLEVKDRELIVSTPKIKGGLTQGSNSEVGLNVTDDTLKHTGLNVTAGLKNPKGEVTTLTPQIEVKDNVARISVPISGNLTRYTGEYSVDVSIQDYGGNKEISSSRFSVSDRPLNITGGIQYSGVEGVVRPSSSVEYWVNVFDVLLKELGVEYKFSLEDPYGRKMDLTPDIRHIDEDVAELTGRINATDLGDYRLILNVTDAGGHNEVREIDFVSGVSSGDLVEIGEKSGLDSDFVQKYFGIGEHWRIPHEQGIDATVDVLDVMHNTNIGEHLEDVINKDPRINLDKIKHFVDACRFVKYVYHGPKEFARPRVLAKVIGNYTAAEQLYGYGRHGREAFWTIGNVTESPSGHYLFLFPQPTLKDMDGEVFVLESDIPTSVWRIVENLRRDSRIAEIPKWYLALNVLAQQDYGLKPTDERYWEIVDPLRDWLFNDDRMGYPLDLPWMSDVNEKAIAYTVLFEFPDWVADLDEDLQHEKTVYHRGFDAKKYVVEQLSRVYEEVSSEYPDGTWTNPVTKKVYKYTSPFYWWLIDREHHGLKEASKQFIGEYLDIVDVDRFDVDSYVLQHCDGINTHLSKNFQLYDLIKHIIGYGSAIFGGDDMKYNNLYLPIAMKAFGIPHSNPGIYYLHYTSAPDIYCFVYEDIIFGFPDEVLQPLRQGKYGEVLIFPGNGLSPTGSPLEGIKKDLAYGQQNPVEPNLRYIEIYFPIKGKKIYLFKGGEKG